MELVDDLGAPGLVNEDSATTHFENRALESLAKCVRPRRTFIKLRVYDIENFAGDTAVKAVVNPIADLAFEVGIGTEMRVDDFH